MMGNIFHDSVIEPFSQGDDSKLTSDFNMFNNSGTQIGKSADDNQVFDKLNDGKQDEELMKESLGRVNKKIEEAQNNVSF